MKKRYSFGRTVFLALLITGFGLPQLMQAAEAVLITHTVTSYVSGGPEMTVTLTLQMQNNSESMMNNITVIPTPMPKDLLFMGATDVVPSWEAYLSGRPSLQTTRLQAT